ncbi:MAG: response regulator [Thermoleophilia bacterium]|nr:response regulator [Thermoleophilia bacterium]
MERSVVSSPQKEGAGAAGTHSAVILVVEDEPSVRSLVVRVLTREGYQVLEAGSSDEALDLLVKGDHPVDLLLTDVVLPGVMGGPQLAACLLEQNPRLPVLYMSGYPQELVEPTANRPSKLNFLAKPFPPQVLVERVRELLRDRELS